MHVVYTDLTFQKARGLGIHIYVIGITLKDTREIEAIASKPATANMFNVDEFDELEGLGEKIFASLCPVESRYCFCYLNERQLPL